MRILVAGAGAVGGYFGGRLVEIGEDVTFLVRSRRKQELDDQGLIIQSVHGDFVSPVQSITNTNQEQTFDLIIMAAKAYQLSDMIEDCKAFINANTRILPLLNGYAHYEVLKACWGDQVLGGLCFIESTLSPKGEILQTSPQHRLTFGSFTSNGKRELEIADHLQRANLVLTVSDQIMQDIWTKYTYITCLAGMTSLMRSPLGAIRDNQWGWQIYERLASEVTDIAAAAGFPVSVCREQLLDLARTNHAGLKSSMQRDMEKGLAVEADHLHGYLLDLAVRQGSNPITQYPVLATVYANLKIYESQQKPS